MLMTKQSESTDIGQTLNLVNFLVKFQTDIDNQIQFHMKKANPFANGVLTRAQRNKNSGFLKKGGGKTLQFNAGRGKSS